MSIHDYHALRIKRRRPRASTMQPPDAIALRYAAAVKRIMQAVHKEIEASVMPLIQDIGLRQDSPALLDLGKLHLFNRIKEIMRAMGVGGMLERIGALVARHARAELSKVIGIPLADVLPLGTIESFVRSNVAKIESLAVSELDRVYDTISVATTKGLRVEELRDNIVKQFGVSENYGALLARDQTLKLNGQISQERQTQAGITQYRWSSSKDARTRPEHAALDGTVQLWGSPPVTSADGRRNAPGQDYQCRCVAVPIVEDLLG